MDDICVKTGQTIRKLREKKGLSQEKLADIADLHRTYIGHVERGEKNLTLRSLERIAKALGVSVRDLI
jgi:transcriptional regulator with XRE-family HTH domain